WLPLYGRASDATVLPPVPRCACGGRCPDKSPPARETGPPPESPSPVWTQERKGGTFMEPGHRHRFRLPVALTSTGFVVALMFAVFHAPPPKPRGTLAPPPQPPPRLPEGPARPSE